MPSKKRKANQGKAKKQTATKVRARKVAMKASSKKASTKKEKKAKTASTRSRSRKKATINPVREIQQETRDRKLIGASGPRPQSDFQGISRAEEADSESVEELVEEGNVLESGAVAGVEAANNEEGREVHTRELPEDDVPDEYLEKE